MTLRLTAHTVATDTDDGAVLLSQRTGHYWQLNRTGAYALQRLLAGCTTDQLAEEFAARFDIAPTQAREDLTAMTEQLQASGLAEAG
ncbi:lasso peptide biosynthesis PqqD family chaperone [Streptomyces pinistramenti]|uniref:lasso peptide biosynthesis PqqD family chaperone n=1 Tax=Streptomyces pinistramenti TaxID=2884812 RepID=UPI001D074B7E|nr:lasso peptide biosynthesis PqqD family chaperone [Streptomyces pinistramenti]MCB5907696.1 lasso peptide biosynthesis PqqD family chaperone [Streptomyces pinistramenti]